MKHIANIFILILCTLIAFSCEKGKDALPEPPTPILDDDPSLIQGKHRIDCELIDSHIHIKFVDITTNKTLIEWIDPEITPTHIDKHLGYGEYKKIKVTTIGAGKSWYHDDKYLISVYLGGEMLIGVNFYFIDDQRIVKSLKDYNVYNADNAAWMDEMWAIRYGYVSPVNGETSEKASLYNYNGELIYNIDQSLVGGSGDNPEWGKIMESLNRINDYEYACLFYRVNLKTGSKAWQHSIQELIPELTSQSLYEIQNISANGLTWKYKIEITHYSGDKELKEISINIDTGEYICKEVY